jgi:hypothetical protein
MELFMNKIKSAVLISAIIGASVMSVQAQAVQDTDGWTQLDRAGTIKVIKHFPDWVINGIAATTESHKVGTKYSSKNKGAEVKITGHKSYNVGKHGTVTLKEIKLQTNDGSAILSTGHNQHARKLSFTPDYLPETVNRSGELEGSTKHAINKCTFYTNNKPKGLMADCTLISHHGGETDAMTYSMTPALKAKS